MTVHHLPGVARQHPADERPRLLNLYDQFAESLQAEAEAEKVARVAAQVRRSLRIRRAQSYVKWFSLIAMLFSACWFGWQLGARGH
jgi:hypothetical protein